jgi:hypothetical protein
MASSGEMVLIGDSKDPDGPVLAYSRADFDDMA